jgi:hypothetical protein
MKLYIIRPLSLTAPVNGLNYITQLVQALTLMVGQFVMMASILMLSTMVARLLFQLVGTWF